MTNTTAVAGGLWQRESAFVTEMLRPRNSAVTFGADRRIHVPLPPIIHEDDDLVAFDKPSGLIVAPERRDRPGESLMELVRARLGRHVANVHRLDAEASGVLLCAKSKPALDFLSGQFQSKTAGKTYLAFATVLPAEGEGRAIAPIRSGDGGLPSEFTVDLPLGPDEAHPGKMRIFRKRGGQAGLTEFRVLESFGRFVWLECRPLTGRTHQIRVHLAAIGAPVLGDSLYGDPGTQLLLSELKRRYKGRDEERPLIARLALHASGLAFLHPATREPTILQAPLPNEFAVALKYLRRFAGALTAPGARGAARPPS
jgi:RluA family pseudouridine synthase